MKKLLKTLSLCALVLLSAACGKEEEPVSDNNTPPTPPTEEEGLVTGEYHFLAAEYVDEEGKVVAEGYNTFRLERDEEGNYRLCNLLQSRVEWLARWDEEQSLITLTGEGWLIDPTTLEPDNNGGASWFVMLNNLISLEQDGTGQTTAYGAYGLYSFASYDDYFSEECDGKAPCILRVDKESGRIVEFVSLLTSECYEIDLTTMELGDYVGMLGRALPGTPVEVGAAAKEYVKL